jgi:L-malate glycosyltransferase
MKILFVISSFYPLWGGTENQALLQAQELVRRGHHVRVLTWQHHPSHPRDEIYGGVEIRRMPRETGALASARSMGGMTVEMVRSMRSADVVAMQQINALAYLAGCVTATMRQPAVVKPASVASGSNSDLGQLSRPDGVGRLRRVLSTPLRHHVVAAAMTQEIERDVARLGFRQVVRIPNGVEIFDHREVDQAIKPPFITPGTRLVVATGRFSPEKGFQDLIRAWPRVRRVHPDAVLRVIGSGSMEGELRAFITSAGEEATIRLDKPEGPSRRYLAAADVVVIPSHYDGMSNVLLEAMAEGAVIVATAVSGAVDLIDNGHNGILVRPRDPESLAQGVISGLSASRSTMGEAAREKVAHCCSLAHVVDLYEHMFETLL